MPSVSTLTRKVLEAKSHRDVFELEAALAEASAWTYSAAGSESAASDLLNFMADAQELHDSLWSRCHSYLLPLRRACQSMEEREIFGALIKCQQAPAEIQLSMYTDMRDAAALRSRLLCIHDEAMRVLDSDDTPQRGDRIQKFLREKASYLPERTVSALMQKSRENSLSKRGTPSRSLHTSPQPFKSLHRESTPTETPVSRRATGVIYPYFQETSQAPWRQAESSSWCPHLSAPASSSSTSTSSSGSRSSSSSSTAGHRRQQRHPSSIDCFARAPAAGTTRTVALRTAAAAAARESSAKRVPGSRFEGAPVSCVSPWRQHRLQTKERVMAVLAAQETQGRQAVELEEKEESAHVYDAALREATMLVCQTYGVTSFAGYLTSSTVKRGPLLESTGAAVRVQQKHGKFRELLAVKDESRQAPQSAVGSFRPHQKEFHKSPRREGGVDRSAWRRDSADVRSQSGPKSSSAPAPAVQQEEGPMRGTPTRRSAASVRSGARHSSGGPALASPTSTSAFGSTSRPIYPPETSDSRSSKSISRFDISQIRLMARLRAVLTEEEIDRRDIEAAEEFDRTVKLFPFVAKLESVLMDRDWE